MEITFKQSIGKRTYQQDAYYFGENSFAKIFVVCDGLGSLSHSDIASNAVTKSFEMSFEDLKDDDNFCSFLKKSILNAIDYVNTSLEEKEGATTLLATIITNDKLYYISVGDSPLLLLRNGKFTRINRNHSTSCNNENFDSSEPFAHTNILTSCISNTRPSYVDFNEEPLQLESEDIIIISSDGILDVGETEMMNILQTPQTLTEKLNKTFDDLQRNKYMDNTTTFFVKI